MAHVLLIAIEHKGWPAAKRTDAAFGLLGPMGVIHLGIHISIEPVVARSCLSPGGSARRSGWEGSGRTSPPTGWSAGSGLPNLHGNW